MADGESLYLIAGIALASIIATVAALVTGIMQHRTAMAQAALNRKLELERLNHASKLEKLQNKIGMMWTLYCYVGEQSTIRRFVIDTEQKITTKSLTPDDLSDIMARLRGEGHLEGPLTKIVAEFIGYPETQQFDLVEKYLEVALQRIQKKVEEESNQRDVVGWSLMVRNRMTVKQMIALLDYLEEQSQKVMSVDEENKFEQYFNSQLEEIQEALRVEINLEAEPATK